MDRTTFLQTGSSAKPAISAASFVHMVKDGAGAAKIDAAKASASFANTHKDTAQTAGQSDPPQLFGLILHAQPKLALVSHQQEQRHAWHTPVVVQLA